MRINAVNPFDETKLRLFKHEEENKNSALPKRSDACKGKELHFAL